MADIGATAEPFFAGRLSKGMSDLLREWNEQPRLAWELENLSKVLQVDQAHVIMLAEEAIITEEQAGSILRELDDIRKTGSESFTTQPGLGSIVLQIEGVLAARLGENTAGRLPIARSRLDQGATVKRICDRENVLTVISDALALHETLLTAAETHKGVAMIGYTHLQQAQPANFGHYLLAFKDRFDDSLQQMRDLYDKIDRCPLGAVGLSGTDVPINRQRTAELLGFSEVLNNSRLGRDAYYQIEITFCLAYVMTILNDICTDLHVFSSIEFGTVELDDSHCSTSSVFPQKKNPYALETVKGKAGEANGWVATAFATFRNEGTADTGSRTVPCLSEAYRTTKGMLRLTAEILEGITVKKDRWEELLGKAWVTTNRLANILLTKHGLNYRTAHGVVARLVKNCLTCGVTKKDVTIQMLGESAREMGAESIAISQDELRSALDHTEFILESSSFGGVSPKEFERLQTLGKDQYLRNVTWTKDKVDKLAQADIKREAAAKKFIDIATEGA